MANLAEIYGIEVDSREDPAVASGDVLLAVRLREKIHAACVKKAVSVLQTSLPTGSGREDAVELLAWAQRAIASPDTTAQMVLRIILGANAGASVSQILNASDSTIEGALSPLLPLFAKGMSIGR